MKNAGNMISEVLDCFNIFIFLKETDDSLPVLLALLMLKNTSQSVTTLSPRIRYALFKLPGRVFCFIRTFDFQSMLVIFILKRVWFWRYFKLGVEVWWLYHLSIFLEKISTNCNICVSCNILKNVTLKLCFKTICSRSYSLSDSRKIRKLMSF